MAQQDREIKTINFPGMVVRVHIPNISDADQAARMAEIHKQAARLLKSMR